MLKEKRILLGVTGSIAAYKAVELTRELVKRGVEVQVVMTEAAATFAVRLVPAITWLGPTPLRPGRLRRWAAARSSVAGTPGPHRVV
ncbi:MAG: hypothetical protein HYT85_15440 [candidate division NC10 bacterium]|nr:hypothetical protein [candidate division NC10 bacterium]